MPAIKVITPILGDRYYHIFNRGNNGQQVFFTEENYRYFLRLFHQFIYPYVDLLAYSIMPNHFHFMIRTKDSISFERQGIPSLRKDEIHVTDVGNRDSIPFLQDGIPITDEAMIGKIISNQFRRLFITFSMAINIQQNRTGSLFSKNFKRLEIDDEDYLRYVAFYIHFNPKKTWDC
jgi:putative transposase